jgi:hypothetical protein
MAVKLNTLYVVKALVKDVVAVIYFSKVADDAKRAAALAVTNGYAGVAISRLTVAV